MELMVVLTKSDANPRARLVSDNLKNAAMIEWLDSMPLWGVVIAVALLLAISLELGYRMGRWRRSYWSDEKEQPVGAMVGSILGLLALLLGFTFSTAASRFEARRQGVLEEANAIGTTYLRTRLLPDPEHAESSKLLREYVDVRLRGIEARQTSEAIARSEVLHELLWQQAVSASQKSPDSITVGLYVQSLNSLIDMHAKRILIGIRSRMPIVIWMGLLGLNVIGMAAIGYQAGLSATRRSPAMIGLVLAFAIVLGLIADLDRGQEGLLQVGQQAIIDVQRSMQSTP